MATLEDLKEIERINLISSWITGYGDDFSILNGTEVYCNICSTTLLSSQKSHIQQHVNTKTHSDRIHLTPPDTFYADLCEAFVSAHSKTSKSCFEKIP